MGVVVEEWLLVKTVLFRIFLVIGVALSSSKVSGLDSSFILSHLPLPKLLALVGKLLVVEQLSHYHS